MHREVALTLDDVLLEDGQIAAFRPVRVDYIAMGRFGNVLLVNGEADPSLTARHGEVVRLYLTNTANTRVFNVAIPGARMKLVGGDSGRYEREELVDSVLIAPSERAVVDVLFDSRGGCAGAPHARAGHTPWGRSRRRASRQRHSRRPFAILRTNSEWLPNARASLPICKPPDKTLALVAVMDMGEPDGPVDYFCPMHPAVVSGEPGRCPDCGMKFLPRATPSSYVCPMHPEVVSHAPGPCPICGMALAAGRARRTRRGTILVLTTAHARPSPS